MSSIDRIPPPTVNGILAYSRVRQTIGEAARVEAIAALQGIGITNEFLGGVAGQVAKGAAEALLTKTAVRDLIDAIAVKTVLGMPFSELPGFAAGQVLRSLPLQFALGFSVGQGIGSLFGDNIIGDVIAVAAALPATLAISVTAGIVTLFQWIFGTSNVAVQQMPGLDTYLITVAPAAAQTANAAVRGIASAADTRGSLKISVDPATGTSIYRPDSRATRAGRGEKFGLLVSVEAALDAAPTTTLPNPMAHAV